MSIVQFIALFAVAAGVILWLTWVMENGPWRGTLAFLARLVWLTPLILAFFPETKFEALPRSVALRPIHVLLDDSASTKQLDDKGQSPLMRGRQAVQTLQSECERLGCQVKVTQLSQLSPDVAKGYTPLSQVLEPWLYGTNAEPWLLISDGGDFRPEEPWSLKLKDMGGHPPQVRGAILYSGGASAGNLWIEKADMAPFSFENRPLPVDVVLKREKPQLDEESVQIQLASEDKILSSVNASFKAGESELGISLSVPPLARGQHLVMIKVLPTGYEKAVWDNYAYRDVEVLPNTVGVLHLLGAPSWDGRFLRRYLKSEPKFDLISFFILRDPTDMQMINERELSLIPFPVDRLFNEELPNFHAVVIQNFTLHQFLEPSYQKNLVDFVRNGGGLLFIGGPRALQPGDYQGSPLASILPFKTKEGGVNAMPMGSMFGFGGPSEAPKVGPYYDPALSFRVTLAEPSETKKSLANVFEQFAALAKDLGGNEDFKGLHHMESVELKDEEVTPLLNARLADGREVPLAVASYPGKGRALWIFSDSLWRLAMSPAEGSSREVYSTFMAASMQWLLRQEINKPLILRQFRLVPTDKGETQWHVTLSGPASKYFSVDGKWQWQVCQLGIDASSMKVERSGYDNVTVSGTLPTRLADGSKCTARLSGEHEAFGSVNAAITTVVPSVYKDDELEPSAHKLTSLARLSNALFLPGDDKTTPELVAWLTTQTGGEGISLPTRYKSHQDFYWVFSRWWAWLLLAGLPLEVLIRRWPEIMGRTRRRREKKNVDSEASQAETATPLS